MSKKTDRLDVILLRHGWVSEAQVFQALMEQERLGQPFGSTLVALGFLNETQLAEALAEQFGTPVWDPLTAVVERAALDLFTERWVREKEFLPLAYDPYLHRLEVAVTDPTNIALLDEIRIHAEVQTVAVATVPRVSLERLWNRFYREEPMAVRTQATPTPVVTHAPTSTPDRTPDPGRSRLGLKFGFSVDAPVDVDPGPQPVARVLLWLTQPFVAKLLKSLLEVERCRVADWDGGAVPEGEWDCVIHDDDSVASDPDALGRLKRQLPKIQLIPRPALTSSLLRSPLSYEHLRDGYIHFAEYAQRWVSDQNRDKRLSRYALAIARLLPMTHFEVDTLFLACEMAPLFGDIGDDATRWDALAAELRCPYPIIGIYKSASIPFNETGMKSGESTPELPLGGRVFHLVATFLRKSGESELKTIDALTQITDWMRQEAGSQFDPLVVEALIRVTREEVLEGCLPPGPAEVFLVSDHPIDWNHLRMLLENEGWRVVIAEGAAEARKLAERRRPDAVVWAADGAIEWIRWQKETLQGLASFLLLDEANQALARRALELGFEDVWSEPWDPGMAIAKLRRAVTRKPATAQVSGSVTGSLDQLSFIDLVQILTTGARSVTISVTSGDLQGRVILWQGQIRFAETADLEGEQAVYEILTWNSGSFDLRPAETVPARNCHAPNDAILLEGCRLMDEKKGTVAGLRQ